MDEPTSPRWTIGISGLLGIFAITRHLFSKPTAKLLAIDDSNACYGNVPAILFLDLAVAISVHFSSCPYPLIKQLVCRLLWPWPQLEFQKHYFLSPVLPTPCATPRQRP